MNATARRDKILCMLDTDPFISDRKRRELIAEVQKIAKAQPASRANARTTTR